MEKFRGGEWTLMEDNFVDGCVITGTERTGMSEICEISSAYIDGNTENSFEVEQLANAHLIAAAPDMYKLLEKYHNESRFVYGEDYDEVEALLSKAKGE